MRIVTNTKCGHMNVFAASEDMVTPYHFDHGHNFLCQISNEKSAWLWQSNDRDNLPYSEIEDFYLEAWDCSRHKLDFKRAQEFRLHPGDALHHPSLAPHWGRERTRSRGRGARYRVCAVGEVVSGKA